MSKEQSTILKGIAILMMLFYHLFFRAGLDEMCSPLIMLNDDSLVSYLSRACYPVPFFLILSGYGLTYLYCHGQLGIRGECRRLWCLYLHLWIVLLVFMSLAYFLRPGMYHYDLLHILGNMTAIRCNYNGEVWFLFPYALVCLTSVPVIRYVYHLKGTRKVALTVAAYTLLFLTVKFISRHISQNLLLNTIETQYNYYVCLLFYFSLGILLYRLLEQSFQLPFLGLAQKTASGHIQGTGNGLTERIESGQTYGTASSGLRLSLPLLLLVGLFIVKSMFNITLLDGLYAFAFIFCFLHLKLPRLLHHTLYELGRRSTVMWMTHTFFCFYIFPDFIYGFKYPLIIFTVLVIVSYLTSVILSTIIGWVTSRCIQVTNR